MAVIDFEDYEALKRCTEKYTHQMHRRCKRFDIIYIMFETCDVVTKKMFENILKMYHENIID